MTTIRAARHEGTIRLFTRPWGFSPRDVTQRVTWWHGDADHIVPFAHAQHIVPMLADAELGAAHEVLQTVAGVG